MEAYSFEFYEELSDTALPSARRVVPLVRELLPVSSVVDVGCGNGSWLSVFREAGALRILGIDGDWPSERQLLIPAACFRRLPLHQSIDTEEVFDLALCLEVAEHFPPDRADSLVADLCRLAPVVLFSAAIPYQGGLNHINEQWPAYWADRFERNGYRTIDVFRLQLWEDTEVTWWYKQNLLLFATEASLAANPKLAEAQKVTQSPPLRLIHPEKYLATARDAQPSVGKWLRRGPQAFRASLAKRRAK